MCQICAITEDLVNSFLSFLQMLWFFCRISEGNGRSDGNLLSDKMRASVICLTLFFSMAMEVAIGIVSETS